MRYQFVYLPNIISTKKTSRRHQKEDYSKEKGHIDIGCFGAMRLLKNQCFQALCAIQAADKLGKILKFHITINPTASSYPYDAVSDRDPISNNLKELFKNSRHELVIHEWLSQDDFKELIHEMDLGLQISFTESFNIVSADFVNNDRLIIVSDAIYWLSPIMHVSTTDYESVVNKILFMYRQRNNDKFKESLKEDLERYNKVAKKEWISYLKKKVPALSSHGVHKGYHEKVKKDTKKPSKDNNKGKK